MWEEKKGEWGGYEKGEVGNTEPIAFNTVTHQRNTPDMNSYRPFFNIETPRIILEFGVNSSLRYGSDRTVA
jgi:hypothetical protein